MIRTMLVDDHAVVRAGLETVLDAEPDFATVASTDGGEELWPRFRQTRPDLVLVGVHLPGRNSLAVCRRLKAVVPAPRVVFYSDHATGLAVPLRLAGADGLAGRGGPASELFGVLRRVARGETVLPPVTPDLLELVCKPLAHSERILVGLLLNGATVADVAQVIGHDTDAARHHIDALLGRVMPLTTAS